MVTFFFFRLTCSVLLWGGRTTENKHHWHVLPGIQPHWVCPLSWSVCFPNLHCSGPRLLCRELSEAGPGLYALPRSKPLRFRLSGPPQRLRLGWACVLRPSLVRAAQVTRCLAHRVAPQLKAATYPLPRLSRSVFWVGNRRPFLGVPCVYSGELVSGCCPPGRCRSSRTPRSLG